MRLRKIIKNKKALSEIVSYTLLILIAFVIGTAVFVWIWKLVDKGEPEQCPEGVSIVIRNAVCNLPLPATPDTIIINVSNQGRFNITGFVVKGSNNPNVKAAVRLDPNDLPAKLDDLSNSDLNVIILKDLGPGEEGSYSFSYSTLATLSKISIGAIRNQSEQMVVCTNSFMEQDVSCT